MPQTQLEPIEAKNVVNYGISDAAIAALREQYLPLACDTPAGYEKVRVAVADIRERRVLVEKTRKSLKEDSLAWGRKVDSEAKRIESALLEIEEPLKAKKKAVDDEKENLRLKKEAEARARIEAELKAKRDIEEARLKAERDAEHAKLAEQKAEADRLAAERAKVAAEQAAAQKKIDDDLRALEQATAKAEREEFERQAKVKAEAEARERVEREKAEEESRRLAAERREAEEKSRIEAMRPDVDKINRFAALVRALPIPMATATIAADFVETIEAELQDIANRCEEFKGDEPEEPGQKTTLTQPTK